MLHTSTRFPMIRQGECIYAYMYAYICMLYCETQISSTNISSDVGSQTLVMCHVICWKEVSYDKPNLAHSFCISSRLMYCWWFRRPQTNCRVNMSIKIQQAHVLYKKSLAWHLPTYLKNSCLDYLQNDWSQMYPNREKLSPTLPIHVHAISPYIYIWLMVTFLHSSICDAQKKHITSAVSQLLKLMTYNLHNKS